MRSFIEPERGQNPIHPKTLIKVALFAIHNCRFSLRKMESDTALNLAYRWLTGDRTIDHSTIGKFLSRYRHIILDLFSQTVLICVEHELEDFKVLSIDSIKIRVNASHKQHKTLASIEKERKKIEEKLEEQNIDALIPERRMSAEERTELSKGEYDRSKFSYQSDTRTYICPAG